MRMPLAAMLCVLGCLAAPAHADDAEPVFSGPQVGEPAVRFEAIGVFDDSRGKRFDPVATAEGHPLLLVFVHQLTRPSVGLARVVLAYAAKHRDTGLHSTMVFLGDDQTALTERLTRARHALPTGVPVGIAADGAEGPGAYGLNRNVTLTILVIDRGIVAANFALVQPSIQADAPRVASALAMLLEVAPPTLAELTAESPAMRRGAGPRASAPELDLRALLAPVIRRRAGEEEIAAAAKRAEAVFAERPEIAAEVGRVARRIIAAKRLDQYGEPAARDVLTRWAEAYPEPPGEPTE